MTMKPLAQEYSIVIKRPAEYTYCDGVGLVKLSSGRLLATIPIVPYSDAASRHEMRIARSDDHGQTWEELEPIPYHSGCPFVHDGKLYLSAHRPKREDVVILRSDDEGETWLPPVTLYKGPYFCCATGTITSNGQWYRAIGTGRMCCHVAQPYAGV